MTMSQAVKLLTVLAVMLTLAPTGPVLADGSSGGIGDTFGPRFKADPSRTPRGATDLRRRSRPLVDAAGSVQRWNQIAIDATGLDHTPITPEDTRAIYAEQLGPGRSRRAIAIVHLAIFEVVNAIEGNYKSYAELAPARVDTSLHAGITQAAHDTLVSSPLGGSS